MAGATEPFGFHMAMSEADIMALGATPVPNQYLQFRISAAPKPHPRFESFIVSLGGGRIAAVTAFSRDIKTNVYGEAVLGEFDALFSSLNRKYGVGQRFDFLKTGSIWGEPNEWTRALLNDERTLIAFWTIENLSLPSDLEEIRLSANMYDIDTAYLALRYQFANYSAYESEVAALEDEAL